MSLHLQTTLDGHLLNLEGKLTLADECCCNLGCCDFTEHPVPCIGIRVIFLDGYPVVPCSTPDIETGLNFQDFEWIAYSADGGGIWGAVNSFWNGGWGQSFNVDCAVIDNQYVWAGVAGDCADDTYANKLAGATTLSCDPFHVIWKGPDDLGHSMSNSGCCSSTDDPAAMIWVEAYEIDCPEGVGGEGEGFMGAARAAARPWRRPLRPGGVGTTISSLLTRMGIESRGRAPDQWDTNGKTWCASNRCELRSWVISQAMMSRVSLFDGSFALSQSHPRLAAQIQGLGGRPSHRECQAACEIIRYALTK